VAPGTSCYMVFAKLISLDLPLTYIYIDDMALTITPVVVTGIDKTSRTNMLATVNNKMLKVTGVDTYTVYNVQGVKVTEVMCNKTNNETLLKSGLYIIKSGKKVQKVIVN